MNEKSQELKPKLEQQVTETTQSTTSTEQPNDNTSTIQDNSLDNSNE